MQTVLSIIRELFAETTFKILWHAMHAGESVPRGTAVICTRRANRNITRQKPEDSKKRAGGTQSYKNRRRENNSCANLPLLTGAHLA